MRFSKRSLPIAGQILDICARAHGFTYWVHTSCAGQLDTVLEEAIEMASRATARMNNFVNDKNQEKAFEILWNPPNAQRQRFFNEVQRIESGIAAFTSTNDWAASDLRIYCDDDDYGPSGRWQPCPDNPVVDEGLPNSRKTLGRDQRYYDTVNKMRRNEDSLGCKTPDPVTGRINRQANLFDQYQRSAPGQNPIRHTLTICDYGLRSTVNSIDRDLPFKKNISALGVVDAFTAVKSFVVLHELTHFESWRKEDDFLYPYEWTIITQLPSERALGNADQYAYFGLVAKLADRFWRLAQPDAQAEAGRLVYDKTIPH